jgi:nucleotide-binding universal stress UspA family protein
MAEIDPTVTLAVMQEAANKSAALATALRDRLQAEDIRWAVEDAGAQVLGIAGLVAPRARFADLVVLARPIGPDRPFAAEDVLEAALFGGHAPVLVVPPGGLPAWPPAKVVIAWDGGDEAMAAVRAARPLLDGAVSATVAVVDQGRWGAEGDDPGGAVARYLVRHGVLAEVAILPRGGHAVAEVLNAHVRDAAADLLVMGAYAHTRLREMILGGTTRDMLRGATVPVLMAR